MNLSSSWHYIGNVTLSGAQSSCEILRLPCVLNPNNTAMEYDSGASIAYVETASVNNVEYTIVLINGEPYCVSPKVLVLPECPSVIETTSVFEGTTAAYTNLRSGLELILSINSTLYNPGQGISVNITEFNMFPTINNVTAASDWPIANLLLGACNSEYFGDLPMGIEVLEGYFSQNNISSATASDRIQFLSNPFAECPRSPTVTYYIFQPGTDRLSSYTECNLDLLGSCNMSVDAVVNFNRNWTVTNPTGQGAIGKNLAPGVYTVVGGDEWGSIVILHFLVSTVDLQSTP